MTYRQELDTMIAGAHEAGSALLETFGQIQDLSHPVEDATALTAAADLGAARTLSRSLIGAYPQCGLLIEGTDEIQGEDQTRRWIVDPMDGTANFISGLPHWAISVALERDGEIVAAVVHDPVKGETFSASASSGAWLNGNMRLQTSGKSALNKGMLATGMPPAGAGGLPIALATFERVLKNSSGIRQWGAAALDLAYVAAGRLDGYWNRNLKPWHFAAGLLLVKEAGGSVEPLEGAGAIAEDGDLVAICSDMHPDFAAALQDLR